MMKFKEVILYHVHGLKGDLFYSDKRIAITNDELYIDGLLSQKIYDNIIVIDGKVLKGRFADMTVNKRTNEVMDYVISTKNGFHMLLNELSHNTDPCLGIVMKDDFKFNNSAILSRGVEVHFKYINCGQMKLTFLNRMDDNYSNELPNNTLTVSEEKHSADIIELPATNIETIDKKRKVV